MKPPRDSAAMNPTKSQYLATAAFHERMSRAYASAGKAKDAKAAEDAAKRCRENAQAAA